jgi:hypothetical protein
MAVRTLNKTKFAALVLSIFIGLAFWLKGLIFLDPDFGWHLKMGQLILSSGIPQTDPFSYTMKSFPFVDHEWLTNVLTAWAYPQIGHPGLAWIYALLAWGAILIALKIPCPRRPTKANLWYLEPAFFLFAGAAVLPFVGIRPQVVSWFFLAIFLAVTLDQSLWQKWSWCLPFLLILWANLHGGFPIGILVLIVVVAGEAIQQKRLVVKAALILVSSVIASLINPYGKRLWGEVWQQISDTSLRQTIAEWQPSFFYFNLPFLFLVASSSILIFRYRFLFKLEEIALFLFFSLAAFLGVRHTPLWVIVSLPIVLTGSIFLLEEVINIKYGFARFKKFFLLIFGTSCLIFLASAMTTLSESRYYSEEKYYPFKAINFIRNNPVKGEIFSEYGWGGYLIWKLPEKKVFIDGRMPSWRGKKMPSGESNYAMKDYLDILKGEINYDQIFAHYQIKTVLWPQSRPESFLERLDKKLVKFLFKEESKDDFPQRLMKDGWVKVYQDSSSIILQKSD